MTFQRVLYNKTGLVTLTIKPDTGHARRSSCCRRGVRSTYVGWTSLVLWAGVALFFVAMVVFGRLAGNFAEEL